MANTTTSKATKKPSAATAVKKVAAAAQAEEAAVQTTVEEVAPVTEAPKKETAKKPVLKDLDPHMYVTVYNGFNGKLVYKSPKTGERFVWDEFGSDQDMELVELKSARSSSKQFFENNWFMFDDPEIIEWLGMGRYYKNALTLDGFDEVFHKSPEEIKDIASKLSSGQKGTLALRARAKIKTGELDSIKAINALESALDVQLIER